MNNDKMNNDKMNNDKMNNDKMNNDSKNSDIDLNIDNYDLDDILKLFNLDYNLSEIGMKKAKKMVLMTHPDKSKMDKEYFLFFSKAYKMLYSVYDFKKQACVDREVKLNAVYNPEQVGNENKDGEVKERKALVEKFMKSKNFNELFNKMFEENDLEQHKKSVGYGDWLKSDEDMDSHDENITKTTMHAHIENKKKELRSLVPVTELQTINGGEDGEYSNIVDGDPESFSCSIFSNFQYEDLKKAHVESVIPVTNDDMQGHIFTNVEEYQRHRDKYNDGPLSLEQSRAYLEKKSNNEQTNDMQRAYKLAKQEEEARTINDRWMSKFKQLTH